MQLKRPHSSEILHRVVPPLTIWAITRILGTESVSGAVERVDRKIESKKRHAERSMARARRNATSNPIWFFGGLVVVVTGVGMIVKAASRK